MAKNWLIEGAEATYAGNKKIEIRNGNLVTPFIHYQDYYNDLAANIAATQDENDGIFLCGWEFSPDAQVTKSPYIFPTPTIGEILKHVDNKRVPVRAIIYGHPDLSHIRTVNWITSLAHGGALHDQKCFFPTGSHHQKIVIIICNKKLIGYCGGMDISPDRIDNPGGVPWHDVHVKIEGPATIDLYMNFYNRWTDQRDEVRGQADLPLGNLIFNSKLTTGNSTVQIVKTFPNLKKKTPFDDLNIFNKKHKAGYSFAPDGETSIYKALLKAIKQTQSHIYLEDQYLVESERITGHELLADSLRDTINKDTFKSFVILTNGVGTIQDELYQTNVRRNRFWSQLGAAAQAKTTAWKFKGDKYSPYWQHSKTWIFDDELAIVTSANCNRRGYSSDSEIGAVILDNNPEGLPFAHKLRIMLWKKHLNAIKLMANDNDIIKFEDGLSKWKESADSILAKVDISVPDSSHADRNLLDKFQPQPGSRGAQIKHYASKIQIINDRDWQWNNIIDIDGA